MSPATFPHEGPAARVLHIANTRIVAPLLGADATFQERLDWVTAEVGDQLADALARPADGKPLNLICTTTLSKMVSGWPSKAKTLFDQVQARTGLRPAGLLQAYQCAGWGYAVRFAATQTDCRWLLISIVDVDLHEVMGRGYVDVIGGIGFGVTTVGLDLSAIRQVPLCAGPAPNHGFTDLLHAVRAHQKRTGPIPVFLPFLTEGLAGIAQRTVGPTLGPNRHDHYGHSFGADPWIGLAEWHQAHPPEAQQQVTLGAFAYDGYYTLGSMRVGPETRVILREPPGPGGTPSAPRGGQGHLGRPGVSFCDGPRPHTP